VPLTEAGCLLVNGVPVTPGYRPGGGQVARTGAVAAAAGAGGPVCSRRPPGALARRLRLAGVDTGYATGLDDDVLIDQATTQRRVLLTRDRGLLRRRALWLGAYGYGARPDDQLADVLGRFAPPLAPWTRCPACNGPLRPVPKAKVEPVLPAGTRRTYQAVSRCQDCGHVYWRGAHAPRLEALIASAERAVSTVTSGPRDITRTAA
jgi:uncharacterized protein with PIN domain